METATRRQAGAAIDSHFMFEKLLALDREHAKEIRDLRTCIKVLMDMMVAKGSLDRDDFGYRMEAELDRAKGDAEEALRQRNLVHCARCRKEVPRESTMINVHGTVCDRCFHV